MIMVDELRKWPHAKAPFLTGSCHLTTDGPPAELHAFAARIGMSLAWFQHGRVPHYDLTEKRRRAAMRAGAVFVSAREQVMRRRAARMEAGVL